MGQAIQPVSRNENISSPPEPQNSCLPTCVTEALQSIANLFSRIGMANLIGVGAIVLAASIFDALAGVVAALIFCTVKALTPRAEPDAPPPQNTTPSQPVPPVRIPMRVEVLPPGTIRSQFGQHNIWTHRYVDINNLGLGGPDLVAALSQPLRYIHNETCCAITATLIDFFYRHKFTQLTPAQLDALLVKGIRLDQTVRERQPFLGMRPIDIFEFNEGLRGGEFQGCAFNEGDLPIERILTPRNQQTNTLAFRTLLEELLGRTAAGPIAGSLVKPGHFGGLFIDRNEQGVIQQIYVSESSGGFLCHVRYDTEDGHHGAMVVPLGNTVEAAAEHLARFYADAQVVSLHPWQRLA